jgi:hypothetical protein
MEAAWETIKKDAAVTCSIDLFFIGIVFFRKEFKREARCCDSPFNLVSSRITGFSCLAFKPS